MSKRVVLTGFAISLFMWVFTVGHVYSHQRCYDYDGYVTPVCFIGSFPFAWPFYWSWQLQRESSSNG